MACGRCARMQPFKGMSRTPILCVAAYRGDILPLSQRESSKLRTPNAENATSELAYNRKSRFGLMCSRSTWPDQQSEYTVGLCALHREAGVLDAPGVLSLLSPGQLGPTSAPQSQRLAQLPIPMHQHSDYGRR